MTSLLIRNATIFSTGETASLLISDGLIQGVLPANQAPASPSEHVIDAQGLILAPGFIELQINGGFGFDFTEDPGSIWSVAEKLPRYGVTSFLPTVITSPWKSIQRAIDVMQAGSPAEFRGALPLGLHLEGPFLNPGRKGAHNPTYLRPPDASLVEGWSPANGVRLVTLAPELPGAHETIRKLRAQGVVVSAGHSLATFDQAVAAFEAGITYGTHVFNAMPPLEHRSPNLAGALLTTPGLTVGLIVDGIHAHPAVIRLVWRAKGPAEITLVTDAMAALGMEDGLYRLGDFDITVQNGSARLPDGVLAGSIVQPDQEIRNLMEMTGCTLAEALLTFTSTPARVLGLSDRGRIEAGCIADLVLLTTSGHIHSTILQGEAVYTKNGS
jgi:N-acetylglucosamine-6-phosphate deacetylase